LRTPAEILRESRTIALVGASPNPNRPAHGVMRYLLDQGYRVIPVRPRDCDDVLGVPCVATLGEIDEPIDLVDVFRREEDAPAHAKRSRWARKRSGSSSACARPRRTGSAQARDSRTWRISARPLSTGPRCCNNCAHNY
jgi:hypothetical protein